MSDTNPDTVPSMVKIAIVTPGGNFWRESDDSWQGSAQFNNIPANQVYTSSFVYIDTGLENPANVTDMLLYRVYTFAYDMAGNTPSTPTWTTEGLPYRIDRTPPDSRPSSPASGTTSRTTPATG